MLKVGFDSGGGGGGGGGISSLTEDVLASGTGAVPATVVQAQDGAFLFGSDGTITTTVGSGTETGPWRLGAASGFTGVRMYIGTQDVGAPTPTNHVLLFEVPGSGDSTRTTVNAADATGSGLVDLTVGGEQNIECEGAFGGGFGGASFGIPGHHASFFAGTGAGVPFGQPNVISLSNAADTQLDIANRLTHVGQLYAGLISDPTTDVGPKGLVYQGGESSGGFGGALTSCAPNGTGPNNGQLGIGILERFWCETTDGTPTVIINYPLPLNNIGNCVFSGKIYVVARLQVVGASGAVGDRYSITYNVQGSVVTSPIFPFAALVTVTVTTDTALDSDVSQAGNTFAIAGTASGPAGLVFTATGVLAGGQGTVLWQWDFDPLKIV
jgi:hypothetical protein